MISKLQYQAEKSGDDEDKGQTQKRLENALVYQFNRQAREFMFFFPVIGATEQYMMAKKAETFQTRT